MFFFFIFDLTWDVKVRVRMTNSLSLNEFSGNQVWISVLNIVLNLMRAFARRLKNFQISFD